MNGAAPDFRSHPSAYRGRLAPSPTGYLHLGHARTFAVAWARARQAGGWLGLRVEDLDAVRCRPEYREALTEDLRWAGFDWDEGPWFQSQRLPLYRAAWETLRHQGLVYPCRCSRRDVLRAASGEAVGGPDEQDAEPLYPGTCRPAAGQAEPLPLAPEGSNWRFRVPAGRDVGFVDGRYGPTSYRAGRDFGDFLVWRREGNVPSYELAVVVDDDAMGITEVVRGADLLRSTARQRLLGAALGYPAPACYHCPLLRDAQTGRRLAKRAGSLSLRALRQRGTVLPSPAAWAREAAAGEGTDAAFSLV